MWQPAAGEPYLFSHTMIPGSVYVGTSDSDVIQYVGPTLPV